MLRRPSLPMLVLLLLLLAGALALPHAGGAYAVKLAARVLVLALFVLSLDLVIGFTGLVSFGHAAFFGLGAYAAYAVSPEDAAAPLVLVIGTGIGLGGIGALVVGALALRTRGFYFIMVTLAAGQMLYALLHDTRLAGGSDGAYINVKPVLEIGGRVLLDLTSRVQVYHLALFALVLVYIGLLVLVRSTFGRTLQGISANEQRMAALGINCYRAKLVAFTLAGAIAGLAGALHASLDGFVTPDLLGWRESGLGIMMVVLGGTGTLHGPVLGAIVYAGLEEALKSASLVGPLMAEHWRLGTGAALVAAVLLSPKGIGGLFGNAKPAPLPPPPPPAPDILPPLPRRLGVRSLGVSFAGLAAVEDVSLDFTPRAIHAIIGPNGAGKTSLINLICGQITPDSGHVLLDGVDLTGHAPHRIAQAGIGRTFQRSALLGGFSVWDNAMLAAQARGRGSEAAAAALEATGLLALCERPADALSNGERRQLEIALLLANGADILILDEPLAGMGPEETARVVALLRRLRARHTILLVEHDMDAVFACADTIAVLVEGRLVARGTPEEIRAHDGVREAYLGQGNAGGTP